jgi:RNA polymerase sigma-70 factor (ECF subfamily)
MNSGRPGDRGTDQLAAHALAAAAGNSDGFTRLVEATQSDVWRLCAYLVDRQSADDLTQETFLRAHRSLASYRGDAPVRAWLLTITRRVCAAELDARARRRDLALAVRPLVRVTAQAAHHVDLELLVTALPADRRAAFVLTQVIGCDYAEAAAICDCPVGTIRSRVARAREELIAAFAASDDAAAARRGS